MDINRADERKKQILQPGDRIVTAGREIYTILPGEVGIGGSGVVYPAQKEGSDLQYVLKESFPAAGYTAQGVTWARQNGAVQPAGCGPEQAAVLMEQARADFQREKEISQQVGNSTAHAVLIFDLLTAEEITTGGVCYRAAAGDFDPSVPLFLVMEQQNSRGLFLDEILADCKQEPTAGGRRYPLRTGGLPSAYTAFHIFKEVVQAIGAVHRAGYLHGDIQSHNLFLLDPDLAHGELGHGCLLDFGTARKLEPDGLTAPVGDSMVYTTSGYAAPELWDLQGGALRLSPAADLYSAGRLLHWMLTGQIYTGREEQMFYRSPMFHMVPCAVQCPPEALALINQLLRRLLSSDPASRCQSAEELLYGRDAPSVEAVLNLLRPAKNQLGLDLSTLAQGEFVGRDAECTQIGDLLAAGQKPVILWGFGGMGKTELAIEYSRRYRESGQGNVFFVRFAGSFRDTLIGPVADAFSGYSKLDPATQKPKPPEQVLREVLQMLGEYGRDDLLIIDNVDHPSQDFDYLTAEESYKKLLALPIRLLLTTRTEQESQVQVGVLAKEELRAIIRRFYTAPDEVLDALIDAVNGHTLAVELMARMLKADRRMTVDTLLERLNTVGGLNREKDVRISSQKDRTRAGFGEKERIYEHLRILFDCSSLDSSEQMLLRHGFLIPDMGMDSSLFLDCEPGDAAEPLDKLIELGWLQESQGETRILTMHPLVREVVWGELKPDGDSCEVFWKALWHQHNHNDVYSARKMEQMAEAFARAAENLPVKPTKQALLWNHSGDLFRVLGNYDKSLAFHQKALAVQKQVLPPDHFDLASSYLGIGAAWGALGNYHKELAFFQKVVSIGEKALPPDHPQLATSYNNLGLAWGNLGDYQKELEFCQKALAIWEKVLSPDHPDLAVSYNNISGAWGKLGDYQKQLELCQKALAIREKVFPPDHPALAASYNNVGYAFGKLGEHQKELRFLQKALAIFEKLLPPNHPNLATSYNNMGLAWGKLGDHQKELEFCQKAIDIREKVFPPDHPDLAASYSNAGSAWGKLGDHQKELEFCQKALVIREKVLPPDHFDLAASYSSVGSAWRKLGDHQKELECYQKALVIWEKIFPPDDLRLATSYNNVGSAWGDLGDHQKELEYYQKALAIREKILPPDDLRLATSYNNVGSTWSKLGDHQKDLKSRQKALAIWEKILSPDDPRLATSYDNVGYTSGDLGDHQKELEFFQKALAIREKVLPPDHLDLATSYNNVGSAWGDLGDHQKELEFFQKALAIREKVLPPDHLDLVAIYNNVGYAFGKLGDFHKQVEFYQKALAIRENVLPPDHPDLAVSYSHIGLALGRVGDLHKQLEFCQKALAIEEKVLPPDLRALATSYSNVGYAFGKLGEHQKEAEYDQKALAIWEKIFPPNDPRLATGYNNVASLWHKVRDHQKELECYQKVLAIREKVLPPDHPDLAASYNNLGDACDGLGNYHSELEYYQKALAIRGKKLPPEHPDLADSYNAVGYAFGKLENHCKALEYYEKALAIREKILPPDHLDLSISYNNMGYTWGKLGDFHKQLTFCQQALAIWEHALPFGHPNRVKILRRIAQAYGELGDREKEAEYNCRADLEEHGPRP